MPHPTWKFLKGIREFPKPLSRAFAVPRSALATTPYALRRRSGWEPAKLSMPFIKLALVPEPDPACSSVDRGRMVASWYILSGEAFDRTMRREMGLVTRVVDDAAG